VTVRTIVVGVDGSPTAQRALRWSAELAAPLGANVVAVHGFEPLAWLGRVEPPVEFTRIAAHVRDLMEGEWCASARELGVRLETMVINDSPDAALRQVASERDADLVVVGSRGHGAVKRLLLGSTARRLVDAADLPVTIIPASPD